MNKYKETLKKIIEGKADWPSLKVELSKYNIDDRQKGIKDTTAGNIFEVFTKYYFLTAPELDGLYSKVWLYEEIPLGVKQKLDLGAVEYGIDLLLKSSSNEYVAVQCKFKNDESSKLNWSSDKIANLFAFCPKADGYIVFSNCAHLDKVSLSRQENFSFFSIGHLLEIEPNTFSNIWLLLEDNKPKERIFFNPRPHQKEAINECIQWFTKGEESRGQLILPCGAGKTFTALWIKEGLESKSTLVLVPSLALLRQIKNEWSKQRKTNYQYLCVCSEKDIDKDNKDSIITHTYEIGSTVTTNPQKITAFLNSNFNEKVIFSTYQSLPSIVESISQTEFKFDFVFCDEAHKTAGISKGVFGIIHDDEKVPAKRRLYATATPRIVKESIKKKLGDDLKYTHDMNNPEKYGEEFYRMTFKDAIEQDILVDYKIIAVGVNDSQLSEYIKVRKFVDDKVSIDEVANNYALDYVMSKFQANHALTFHSRVKLAKEFSFRHSNLYSKTNSYSVDGTQSTSLRNQILNEFRNSKKAIISNARCLTEGVDVPTIDLVYFCDPKNSKVDIIQAVGRALRKKEGKKLGYIVVPIYHEQKGNLENSISKGSFKNLLQVIRSLCDQDERLQVEINSIAFGKGKRTSKKIDIISTFEEDIESLHLIGFEEKLRASLFDQIIYKTSNNWDVLLLELKEYLQLNEDYPSKKQNKDLYVWVSQQRNRKNKGNLKLDKIKKLNSINFAWDIIEFKWNRMFKCFEEYAKNTIFQPCKGIDDKELVAWYNYQKNNIKEKGKISKNLKQKFLDIDKTLTEPSYRKKWLKSYDDLVEWRLENTNKWPAYDKQKTKSKESKLHVFCQIIRKRYRENNLTEYWLNKMLKIEFNFEGIKDNWTITWEKLNEQLSVLDSITPENIGANAYQWIIRHRNLYLEGKLSDYKREKIHKLNLSKFLKTWAKSFKEVKDWYTKHKALPKKSTNRELHLWLTNQRLTFRKGNLSRDQITSLESINFNLSLDGNKKKKERWLEMYYELSKFRTKNPNSWPKFRAKGLEGKLYNWCQSNRQAQAGTAFRRKPLKKWKVEKLNEINFHWSAKNRIKDTWEEHFNNLKNNINENNFVEIPSHIENKINPLYTWWRNQKKDIRDGKLTKERLDKLLSLNVDLNTSTHIFKTWDKNFEELKNYTDPKGRISIPHKIEGKTNKLYAWLNNQRSAFKKGKLSKIKIDAFISIGIDLGSDKRDGFTKWSKRIKEITLFIEETGHYPKAGKSKYQTNLYQSLITTKKAFKNNQLTDEQLDLLKELGIEL